MPDPIFERYKEALRAGHVAALRGRPDDALLQYRSAAAIAPDRALPHVGMAEVLLRIGRLDEALAACTVALRLAPHDESVLELAGRVHETAGRGADASIHLDRLVDLRERQGRTADALGAATRAHAAEPTDARRDRVSALTAVVEAERARLSNPAWAPEGADAAGTARIAGDEETPVASPPNVPASAVAEAPAAVVGAAAVVADDTGAAAAAVVRDTPVGDAPDASFAIDMVVDQSVQPDAAIARTADDQSRADEGASAGTAPLSPGTAVPVAEQEAGSPPVPDGSAADVSVASGIPAPPPEASFGEPVADPGAIFVAAEEQAAAGDPAGAAALYMQAAGAYLGMGAVDTAVDACLRALSGAPADTDVHLALARIDLATGHDARAADRLDLLGRLLSLEGDESGVARVAAFRAGAGSARERDGSTPGASATHRRA